MKNPIIFSYCKYEALRLVNQLNLALTDTDLVAIAQDAYQESEKYFLRKRKKIQKEVVSGFVKKTVMAK